MEEEFGLAAKKGGDGFLLYKFWRENGNIDRIQIIRNFRGQDNRYTISTGTFTNTTKTIEEAKEIATHGTPNNNDQSFFEAILDNLNTTI